MRRHGTAASHTEQPMRRKFDHVAVLMGGWSAEREVSLNSGKPCADAIEQAGYRVTRVDVDRDIANRLAELKPDVCFNALHGRWGEDGCIQGVLECLALPYTHSGVLASALAMNKQRTREIVAAHGVPVAKGRVVARDDAARLHALEPPYVIKPIAEGSSVGVVIVKRGANTPPDAISRVPDLDGQVLAEAFVDGKELTCAVIDGEATEIIDIVPAANLQFYDYEAKYAPGGSVHILPADIPADVIAAIQRHTRVAHQVLGCRGVSRCDFRWDPATGQLAFLELNTQPGMTATSLVPDIARHRGMPFPDLLAWMVEDASIGR
jgi:D-alanine-D-alanine ligase